MDDAFLVGCLERVADLQHDRGDQVRGYRTGGCQKGGKRFAGSPLEGHVIHPIGLTVFVCSNNIGVVQASAELGFAEKTLYPDGVLA
jgi:hypothetical protein